VSEVGAEMAGYVDQSMGGFSDSITANIFRDNDAYFAKGLAFFGHAYLTINSAQIKPNEEEMAPVIAYAKEHILLRNVEDEANSIPRENLKTLEDNANVKGIAPAILPLISSAAGAGFPNVVIDEDGIRRRIELLSEYDGEYVAQLVFAPILDMIKPEKIIRRGQTLTLVNATVTGKDGKPTKKNVAIPLDENGRLLINWLKKNFLDENDPANVSFVHLSLYQLKYANDLEEKIIDNLSSIEALGIKNANGYLAYHDAVACSARRMPISGNGNRTFLTVPDPSGGGISPRRRRFLTITDSFSRAATTARSKIPSTRLSMRRTTRNTWSTATRSRRTSISGRRNIGITSTRPRSSLRFARANSALWGIRASERPTSASIRSGGIIRTSVRTRTFTTRHVGRVHHARSAVVLMARRRGDRAAVRVSLLTASYHCADAFSSAPFRW
jgi:hypothetical protein